MRSGLPRRTAVGPCVSPYHRSLPLLLIIIAAAVIAGP